MSARQQAATLCFESLAKERDDLTLIGCWAHARRGFHEALTESKLAAWFVRQIGLLHAVEKELREKKRWPAITGCHPHRAESAYSGTAAAGDGVGAANAPCRKVCSAKPLIAR
jgi:hypothetical protein